MEFRKINENTFQCLLTKEDMEDYDITMEDFLRDHDKTMEFMHQIIERSEEEIDFDISGGGVMSMQISPLPNEGLSLVFTNKQPMTGMDILSHLRDLFRDHLDGLEGDEDLDDEDVFSLDDDDEEEEEESEVHYHRFDYKDLEEVFKKVEDERSREKVKSKQKQRLYYFESFSTLESFCKTWSGKSVTSQILKVKSESGYYLIIQRGRLAEKDYLLLVETLGEYATYITSNETKILSIKEYADTVIAKDAIMALNRL